MYENHPLQSAQSDFSFFLCSSGLSLVNIEIISSPLPSSVLLPPLSPSLCPGARLDLLRPLLWCGGWQALFDSSGGMRGWPCIAVPATTARMGSQVAANLVDLCYNGNAFHPPQSFRFPAAPSCFTLPGCSS